MNCVRRSTTSSRPTSQIFSCGSRSATAQLLFRAIPRELSANAFSELSHIDAQHFLHDLSDEETRALLAELEPDDRAELLEELPGVVVQKLLNLLDPGELAKTQALLGYPED